MTVYEAKKDASKRLHDAGIGFTKMTAKTVGFSDLALWYNCGEAIFVTVDAKGSKEFGAVRFATKEYILTTF